MKEVVNPKLPNAGVRLSMQCYLTPDDTASYAFLYLTRPLVGTFPAGDSEYPVGGRVLVTDGADSAWFERRVLVDSIRNYWPQYSVRAVNRYVHVLRREQFQLQPGRTYTVVALDTTGRRAWGSCTIAADEAPEFRLNLDSTKGLDPVSGQNVNFITRLRLKWPNLPGNQFYRAQASVGYTGRFPFNPDTAITQSTWLTLTDGSKELLKEESYGNDSLFTAFVGQYLGMEQYLDSAWYTTYLLKSDEAYYRFHESLNRYTGENFFTEPVQVYTNVTNGVGVVCSYRMRARRVRVK